MSASFVLLSVLLSASPHGTYPLAAALIIDGRVAVVDVPSRTIKKLELAELVPEEADLSPEKKFVAVSARRGRKELARIYLVDLASGAISDVEVPEAKGEHRFPRFAEQGAVILFSGASEAGPGGHNNPGRLFRMRLSDKSISRVETPEGRCEFSPVGLGGQKVAHVSTSCYIDFKLTVSDPQKKATTVVTSVSGAATELATSPDGKKLVYTNRVADGLGFFLSRPGTPGEKPRHLGTIPVSQQRVHLRFICPKDALFVNGGKVWVLDSETGSISELQDLKEVDPVGPAASPQLPKGEK